MRKTVLLILCIVNLLDVAKSSSAIMPAFVSDASRKWADSVMTTLTKDERIAQLFMIAAWSNKDSAHIKEIEKLVIDWKIGGLIFFQGGPVREALLTNHYQKLSKIPLLIGMDAEWGIAMRIDSTVRFPRQMTVSAINDDSIVYRMGAEIGRQCRRMGIHVNFAPDADINTNSFNPIIGSRSFGDDRNTVARRSLLYMKGLQDNHVLANGKHFPGHGNADTDSHLTLPIIFQSETQMDSMELYPFQQLINGGIGSMMVAHLFVPSLDSTPELPSTLSKPIVTKLLKEKMGFNGLIFTDALNMRAVSSCYMPGILDKLALISGNDILLYSEDVRKAMEQIHFAIENCEITEEEVNDKVRKLLMVKYWCGLNNYSPIDTTNLIEDLNKPSAIMLQREMYEKSVTVLSNKDSLLPFRSVDSLRIASVVIGDKKFNDFQQQLSLYGPVNYFAEDKDAAVSVFEALFNFLANYDYIILSLHGTTMRAQTGFGIPDVAASFIDTVLKTYKTVFVDFGNAYTLSRLKNLSEAKAVVLSYEDWQLPHSVTAQMIMGGLHTAGKLPVNNGVYERNSGVATLPPLRLQYTIPEASGMSSAVLSQIDSIAKNGILNGAMPGCEILVAKDSKVIYHKAFGSRTFDLEDKVKLNDVYDIASITKIAGTALAVMKLHDQKKIDINQPLSKYLTRLKGTNKKQLTIKEIMSHQAGLPAWIPFYKRAITDSLAFSKVKTEEYSIPVADSMFMKNSYKDSLIQWIFECELSERGKYVYSDLGPILMKMAVEKISGEPFEEFLDKNFYRPLKLSKMTFNPLNKFYRSDIVPTENDTVFRKQLIHGYVHDPAAAMQGGISGNAGLFSDVNDLAVIMQLLLNKGSYAGHTFLKPSTVELFTRRQFDGNRRGLLFDKAESDPSKGSPCAKEASQLTFGHQGFTGGCAWADPASNLIYVFLSNRVYPDAANEKLGKMNIRTGIQSVIYKSIGAGVEVP
jgi:beta-N-acetylhexosaminidase